jgi:hypothetical protein
MTSVRLLLSASVWMVLLAAPLPAAAQPIDSKAAFNRLKTLIGTWDATEQGNPAFAEEVVYSMTGRGTVIIEDMEAPKSVMGHMLTAYHLNVDQLVLTHFCGAGNQPRMRITGVSDGGRRLAFEIYDITNLTDRAAYHSTAVEVVFLSDDRVDLVYRGVHGDRPITQVFELTRRKA